MNNSKGDASNPQTPASEAEKDAFLPDDLALVQRAQRGEIRAYDELITRHRGKVYAMIFNMVHHEADAWDLSQEVFIKAWKAIGKFEAKSQFTTWLYRIAHNLVCDWARRRKNQKHDELNEEIFQSGNVDSSSRTSPMEGASPDEELERTELREKIEVALGKLSEEHRQVVLLKDVQGLAYKEIAEVMECTMGTVMSRLFYARQKLQTLLKDEYDAR